MLIAVCTLFIYLLYIYRALAQHMEAFSSQKRDIQWHIQSEYTKEMSMKSEVVSLISTLMVLITNT